MEKTIHRFWAGKKEMPDVYAEYGEQWSRLNPGWSLRMWEEEDIKEFPHLSEVFDDLYYRDDGRCGIELYVQMADVMGYAILDSFGGVYVNCDIQPVRPLSVLPEIEQKAWASYENNTDWSVVNAAMGSPRPHDPFWSMMVEGLPERYKRLRLEEMVISTGPSYLTESARAHKNLIHVFPVETFNPVHWSNVPPGGDASQFFHEGVYPEGVVGVHHWGHKKDGRSNHIEVATPYG